MKILKLDKKYKNDFIHINNTTKEYLSNPSFFIEFFTENEINSFLATEDKAIFYGVIENEKLVAISGLFFEIEDFLDELKLLNINPKDIAEIGACMTLPTSRSKGYMLNLNKELLKIAKTKKIKYILATAHPENISSNKSLQNLKMKFIKEFTRHNFPRNLYILEL
ncbi:GNAT family N-acetyltransferase [Aliarcobacter butzleri]|uniref:GNAT family N-acetyltransferase n=1 Tax=Aliarcobacter butzleri TaxID=28197 RepID=UPI003AF80F1A